LQCFPSYRLLFNPRTNSWQILWSHMNCPLLKTMQLTCIALATTVGEDHVEPIKDMGLLSHAQNTTALQPDVFLNAIHRLVATNEKRSPFCSANYCQGHLRTAQSASLVSLALTWSQSVWHIAVYVPLLASRQSLFFWIVYVLLFRLCLFSLDGVLKAMDWHLVFIVRQFRSDMSEGNIWTGLTCQLSESRERF
jgi:hypothetical protein